MIRHPLEQAAVKFDGLDRASELLKHNPSIVDRLAIVVPQPDGADLGRQGFSSLANCCRTVPRI